MFALFQNLVQKLSGRPHVSPGTWPLSTLIEPPPFDSARGTFGPFGFGDPLEHARVLGRPDRFSSGPRGYCELLYARAGFQIDFDNDRLAYVAFFVAADEYLPTSAPVVFAQPILDSHRLSSASSLRHVETLLGSPKTRDDEDDDETILSYEKNGLTIEFEFAANDHLKRLNIYPIDGLI